MNADKYAEALHLAQEKYYAPSEAVPATGDIVTNPGFSAAATVSGLPDVATPSSRMGVADPGFDMSRFDGLGPSVASNFDQSRFGPVDTAAFDPSRFAPSINPATNTQSFMAAPVDANATGLLSANPGFSAQASVPAIDAVTTGSTTPGLLSSTSIQAANPALSFTPAKGILASQPIQQNQFVSAFPAEVAQNQIAPATVNDVVAAPSLETIQISEQPTIAGPASEDIAPATTQQTQQAVQNEAAKSIQAPAQRTTPSLAGLINKGSVTGGLLGSLAGGPVGGLLGALIGNGINNGSITNPFSGGGFVAPTTQIAGGISNIGGIYGGQYSPGTYAVASNGATVTAQPGGYTSYTNKYGVTETISPTGQISHDFGSLF